MSAFAYLDHNATSPLRPAAFDAMVEALRAGARDFIVKGKLARLLHAIDRELEESRMRQARREAEKALRETEEYVRLLLDSTGEGFFGVDRQGAIKQCLLNPGSSRRGQPLLSYCHRDFRHTSNSGERAHPFSTY